ncbi:MAG: DsbA family protein [Parvibaculum sp.]
MKKVNTLPLWGAALVGLLSLVGSLITGATFAAAEDPQTRFNANDTKAIEQIVRNYLVENPEVMLEVFAKLDEKREAADKAAALAAISENKAGLFEDAYSFVAGNPDGDITIVEFFDYKCPYCKQAVDDILAAADEDGNVRIIYKEFPILSDESTLAAKAAMAAISQNKYMELHRALMETQGPMPEERILRIAEDAGLDVDRLKQDMADPALDDAIERTHTLARQLGIEGTPAFVIGNQLVPGAVSKERLLEVVEEERTACVSC